MAMGRLCAVHRHRDDVPLEVHHVIPLGYGGKDVPANRVSLCSNGHSAVHDYEIQLRRHVGVVPWRKRVRYGPRVRGLGRTAYEAGIAWRVRLGLPPDYELPAG
jgi:HNH endonuclease